MEDSYVKNFSDGRLQYISCGTAEKDEYINPLNTKRKLLYLKTQFAPRSKHFSSR